METRKPSFPFQLLIPVGLLVICGATLINRFVMPLPDFLEGVLIGACCGLMIGGAVLQKRTKNAR